MAVLVIEYSSCPGKVDEFDEVWKCSTGGNIYIRQIGDTVYWYGESPDEVSQGLNRWAHFGYGTIDGTKGKLNLANVPKGRDMWKETYLILNVDSDTKCQKYLIRQEFLVVLF